MLTGQYAQLKVTFEKPRHWCDLAWAKRSTSGILFLSFGTLHILLVQEGD